MTLSLFAQRHELDRDAGATAHAQIERWLVEAIGGGELTPGDRLPSESALAAFFGVSRMTLRQALAGLQDRGVVLRRRGRSGGTFIARPRIDCDLTGLAGFTEQLRRSQRQATARVISAATVPADRTVATALALDPAAPVHRIVRVRSADDLPLALEHSYFPAAVFPGLPQLDLTGSIYELLAVRYQQRPHTATEFLEPVIAGAGDAALLQAPVGAAVMLIERTAYTAAGLPVEYARDLFRPDRVRISVRSGWTGPDRPVS